MMFGVRYQQIDWIDTQFMRAWCQGHTPVNLWLVATQTILIGHSTHRDVTSLLMEHRGSSGNGTKGFVC